MDIKTPLLLDGATGECLNRRGMPAGECPERWILEHPDILAELQREYVQAGSRVVYAPTFGANREKMGRYGLAGEVARYNRELAALSRAAVGSGILVAGNMTGLGLFLQPMGDSTFAGLKAIFKEQAAALAGAGVDLFVIETVTDLADARAAVLAIREVSDRPIFCTFSVDAGGRTMMGTDALAALCVMQGMGVSAFGLNCSTGPGDMLPSFERIAPHATVPLIAKPNAGLPRVQDGKTVFDLGPGEFAGFFPAICGAGVSIVGGCCGSTPAHIRALAQVLSDVTPAAVPRSDAKLAATRTSAQVVHESDTVGEPILCSDDMSGDILEAEEQTGIIKIMLKDEQDPALFEKNQYMITSPLCLSSDDPALLAAALEVFNGRAVYDGSGDIDMETLADFEKKYGLIVL